MTLNANKFGLAAALSVSIIWLVCSVLVWALPGMMMGMSEAMLHIDTVPMGWHLSILGVFFGLVAWSLTAGISAWLMALIYNKLLGVKK